MPSRKHRWEEEHYRFEAIFASSVDAILAVDPMRHIVLASPSVSRIFGYDPDELVGRSISILYARTEDFIEQGRLRLRDQGLSCCLGGIMGPDPRSMGAKNLVCPYHRGSLGPCPVGGDGKDPPGFFMDQGGAE